MTNFSSLIKKLTKIIKSFRQFLPSERLMKTLVKIYKMRMSERKRIGGTMKKFLSLLAVFAFLGVPQGAFAWTYDGLQSLNPFTGFRNCNPCKVERCVKPKLTKCEKLHGYKIQKGQPCGCAAPVIIEQAPVMSPCTQCHRAF